MFLSKLGYSELVQRLFEKMTFSLVDPLLEGGGATRSVVVATEDDDDGWDLPPPPARRRRMR